MEKSTIDMFIINYSKYFTSDKLIYIREKLAEMPEEKSSAMSIMSSELKKPTIYWFISFFFLGIVGIDRFAIGDIGMGLLKLLTLGGCGLLWLIDWFIITDRVKEKNFGKFIEILTQMR
jgi:TM2 domain-containing membrane protein YozV